MRKLTLMLITIAVLSTSCYSVWGAARFQAVSEVQTSGRDADVIVVGSSLAGWAAAITASREGADVILISETQCVGGQASCSGVSTWDGSGGGLNFYLEYSLRGEYRSADVALGGCYGKVADHGVANPGFVSGGDNFCPHPDRVDDDLRAWLLAYDVDLVGPVDVIEIRTDGSVVTTNGTLKGSVVIEATETGELIPVELRREVASECKQHVTWVAGIREPGAGGQLLGDIDYPTDPEYMALLADEWANARMWNGLNGHDGFPVYRRTRDDNGDLVIYLNWLNDAVTAEASKDLTMQQLVFLSDNGYDDWRWGMRPEPYIRTSDYRLNGIDHLGDAPRGVDNHSDSVAVAHYRADYHGVTCAETEHSEDFGWYDIPIGVGIPAERVPILVAMPRSTDISDVRSTSFRMQPNEVNWGEAMGMLAAMAVRDDVLPHDVNVNMLRSELVLDGAMIDVVG